MILKGRYLSLFGLIIIALYLTACQATVQGSKVKGSYELKRSIIMPNFWEVMLNGDVNNVYNAVLQGVKDLDLKIYSKKVDSLSAVVDGFYADATEYSIKLSYESPSVTMMRIKSGLTGNKTLSIQLFQAIEKHLP